MRDILTRFLKRLKVDRWIAEGAPVYWFLAISCVLCGAALGFLYVAAGPLVRSSYRAAEFFLKGLMDRGESRA